MLTKNATSIYFDRFSLQLENLYVEKNIGINLTFSDVDGLGHSGALYFR